MDPDLNEGASTKSGQPEAAGLERACGVRREEVGSGLILAGLIQRAQLLHRRLLATFRTRIPRYFRAWRNGQLKPDAIGRAAQLLRKANILFRLVVEQETGLVADKDRVDQK